MIVLRRGPFEGRDGVWMTFPFDEFVIKILKREVPSFDREWIPATKEWWVSERYAGPLVRRLQGFGYRVENPGSNGSSDHQVLCITPDAPEDLVRAAWKVLARLRHPDHGGDAQTFQRTREAYERLSRGRP